MQKKKCCMVKSQCSDVSKSRSYTNRGAVTGDCNDFYMLYVTDHLHLIFRCVKVVQFITRNE